MNTFKRQRLMVLLSIGVAASTLLVSGCSTGEPVEVAAPPVPAESSLVPTTPKPSESASTTPSATPSEGTPPPVPPAHVDRNAVNVFGKPAINALNAEMTDFVAHAFTDPDIVSGDTTPVEAVGRLRLTGEAAALARQNPTSLTMSARASMPAAKTPSSPYVERLWEDRFVVAGYRVVGTRKQPFLRGSFTGYARLFYAEGGEEFSRDVHRTYTVYLTRNTQSPANLNAGEMYTYWKVSRYGESFVEADTTGPVLVADGGQ